mgnify:FL=1
MKRIFQRLLPLLLTAALLAGSVSAGAAYVEATTPGDPNPTHRTLSSDEIRGLYMDSVHVADADDDDHDWPSNGSIYIQVAGKYTLSDLNGVTIPANLLVDVYQVRGSEYRFLVRYDTRDGSPITVTDASADAKNSSTSSSSSSGFSDVAESDYFADAVAWAVRQGVTTGTGANTFSPDSAVTRAEAVTFLWRAAGEPAPASSASSFSDVTDRSAYYYDAVLWAAQEGITTGAGGGRFDLNSTLSYDQIFTFLCRAAGETASGDDWSAAAVNWASSNGLTDGLSFTAKAGCPRSDVVYCLWKQMGGGETVQDPSQGVPAGSGDLEGARSAIEASLLDMETAIDVSAFGVESGALLDLAEDIVNVENFYEPFTGYYGVTGLWCLEEAGQAAQTLYVGYGNTPESIQQQRDIVVKAWEILDETVEPGMSDYEIAKALHDYVVLNTAYGFPSDVPRPTAVYSGYFSLLWGCGVCTDYAMAYQLLMDMAGIPCGMVTNASHAWNIVQLDGEWYHVDTTWDDPTPNREGYVRYDYFLKSDSYMSQDHFDYESEHPCTSTKYDNANLPDRGA